MPLEKAIEIIELLAFTGNVFLYQDDVDAIKLGTEALKLIQATRQTAPSWMDELLPGETEG